MRASRPRLRPSRRSRSSRSSRPAVAGLVLLLVGVTGCSAAEEDDVDGLQGAREAADALAGGLAGGDLGASTFSDLSPREATADYVEVVEGLDELTPEVEVASVTAVGADGADGADAADVAGGGRAEARLVWTWPVGPDGWTYETAVPLVRTSSGAGAWLVDWGHEVVEPSLGDDSVLELTAAQADRGDVLGAGGRVLVTERPVTRVGVDKSGISARLAREAATAVARLTGVEAAPYRRAVASAGDRAFVEAITYRSSEVPVAVRQGQRDVDGALLVRDERALAPTRTFAAPLLGTVGEVTAEMVEADPDTYRPGDVAGLSGLQARYDVQLRGTPGSVISAVEPGGQRRELVRSAALPGEDLVLTLDEQQQTLAEDVVSAVGPASALVAVRPSTGEVLAAANGPGNDGQNLATFGQYAPGSTFKIVTSLALLRSGLTPDSPVECPATVTVDGREFGNYSDYPAGGTGTIPLRTAVANSCNTAFISSRDRLDDDALGAAAATLGLGVDHDLGFPAYLGEVPPATTQTGAAADTIGQGTVLASPMVMATVIASVQHGGVVVPSLVRGVTDDPPADVAALTGDEAARLREMLRGVVTDGSGSVLAALPGEPVIAKTGTAEYAAADGSTRTRAWMVAARGDLAVAVLVADGASGSGTAGPLLARFLREVR